MTALLTSLVWSGSRASGTGRLIMLALADLSDRNGETEISYGGLSTLCRADASTIKRAAEKLVSLGELRVTRDGKPGETSVYAICADVLREKSEAPPEDYTKRLDDESEALGDIPVFSVNDMIKVKNQETTVKLTRPIAPKTPLSQPVEAEEPMPAIASLPEGYPQNAVGRILFAAGVHPQRHGPMYWWRREHKADLEALLAGVKISLSEACEALETYPMRFPDLSRITALADPIMESRR